MLKFLKIIFLGLGSFALSGISSQHTCVENLLKRFHDQELSLTSQQAMALCLAAHTTQKGYHQEVGPLVDLLVQIGHEKSRVRSMYEIDRVLQNKEKRDLPQWYAAVRANSNMWRKYDSTEYKHVLLQDEVKRLLDKREESKERSFYDATPFLGEIVPNYKAHIECEQALEEKNVQLNRHFEKVRQNAKRRIVKLEKEFEKQQAEAVGIWKNLEKEKVSGQQGSFFRNAQRNYLRKTYPAWKLEYFRAKEILEELYSHYSAK